MRDTCQIEARDKRDGYRAERCRDYPLLSKREKLRREQEKSQKEKKNEVGQITLHSNPQTAGQQIETTQGGQGAMIPYVPHQQHGMQTERSMPIESRDEPRVIVMDPWGNHVQMTESDAAAAMRRGGFALPPTQQMMPQMMQQPPSFFNYGETQM